MLHYYEIDIVPLNDDRVAAIVLSIVNQISDSQMLIMDHKPASHLQAGYNKYNFKHSIRFSHQKESQIDVFQVYTQLLHNRRSQTSNGPPIFISVSKRQA